MQVVQHVVLGAVVLDRAFVGVAVAIQLGVDLLEEVALFAVRQKRTLEASDDHVLEVFERKAVVFMAQQEFAADRGVGDEMCIRDSTCAALGRRARRWPCPVR